MSTQVSEITQCAVYHIIQFWLGVCVRLTTGYFAYFQLTVKFVALAVSEISLDKFKGRFDSPID